MKSLTECVQMYKQLLEQKANMAVIDTFYDAQIIQIENDQSPVVGRQRLREIEEQNLAKVSALHQQITTLVVDESQQIVMGEMIIKFTGKQGEAKRLNQAFIQKWKDRKIVYQRFYYGGFIPDNQE
jgi:hypothetical protein